jgi:choline dehydrogenase-like flavoprotein
MQTPDFAIIGSGGGGGTIAWLLAKAGFRVVLLEQGSDFGKQAEGHLGGLGASAINGDGRYNAALHDEYRFRLERPDPKRRLRGSFNTFRRSVTGIARPLTGMGGFTGSILGGGSILWGTWSFRSLPIDFRLRDFFREQGQLKEMEEGWGYSIPNWPIDHRDMEPFYNLTEAFFAVCGDRKAVNAAVTETAWYN